MADSRRHPLGRVWARDAGSSTTAGRALRISEPDRLQELSERHRRVPAGIWHGVRTPPSRSRAGGLAQFGDDASRPSLSGVHMLARAQAPARVAEFHMPNLWRAVRRRRRFGSGQRWHCRPSGAHSGRPRPDRTPVEAGSVVAVR